MGAIVREHIDFLKKIHNIAGKTIPFTGLVIVNTISILGNGKVNVRTGEWAFLPLSYINAMAAVWIYFCIALLICKKVKRLAGILRYIGENSIVFVCTNHPVIHISRKLLEIMWKGNYVVGEMLVFVISVVLMICLSEVFLRTKLKFFIGK